MRFITTKTKVAGIVASAITILALITLVMLSSLINFQPTTRIVFNLIYSTCLMLIMLIWKGILDIFVFKEYKCQCKHLCAEGILNICMGALLAITGVLFAVLQGSAIVKGLPIATVDIRYFLFGFVISMCTWKLTEMIISINHKHYDSIIDIINFALWIILAGLIITTIFVTGHILTVITWVLIAETWVLLVLNCLNILISYVIKDPTYLETEEAIKIKEDELEVIQAAKEKERLIIKGKDDEAKLKHLKKLLDQNLITLKDYEKAKSEIIGSIIGEIK